MTLRKVIKNLAYKETKSRPGLNHIPYRESKLTSLLKNSLNRNSYCVFIACLSPSDINYDENLSTLNYASLAKSINNQPIVPIVNDKKLIRDL